MHEWWGLVRIDRTTREAYDVYASLTPPEPGDGSGGGGGPVITTGAAEICAQVLDGEVPTAGYSVLVANGSWNDWAGFGLELTDGDGDGRFCGVLESMVPGDYEFVFAQTGETDSYSGWGEAATRAGPDCDWSRRTSTAAGASPSR